MARLEKGKGSRKRSVELRRLGALLTRDEVDGPSVMLTGYRRYPSEDAARAGLEREVARARDEGLAAVDDEARAIVAALPAKPSGTPELPLRRDLFVYNEATGFMVTSLRMAGKPLEDGSAAWNKAVTKGDILPFSLYQDDPFVVRVVVGDDLREDEAEEWVARVDAPLDVRDGKLCITGGAPFVSEDYEPDDSYYDQFVRTVDIPKGKYLASVYTYVPGGINGSGVLDHLAGGYDAAEPAEDWWKRTRPDEAVPGWVQRWAGEALDGDDDDRELVGFLVHLTPVDALPKKGLSEVGSDGWFPMTHNARKPERCPRGLEARDVVRPAAEGSGGWLFAHDVIGPAEELTTSKIAGGPVEVPVEEAALVARLAWFSSRLAMPALRVSLPKGAAFDLDRAWPESVIAVASDDTVRFLFSNDLQPTEMLGVVSTLGATLRELPDGSHLELSTIPAQGFDIDPEAGRQRYAGEVRDGTWRLASSYPRMTATTLRKAIELAHEVTTGKELSVASDQEGAAILSWAKGNFGLYLEDNPAQLSGSVLRLRKTDAGVLALYGVAAFAVRFGETFRVTDLRDDDDAEESGGGGDPWDLDEPPRGPELLRSPSGRVWFHTMGLLWSEELAQRVKEEEPSLRGAGFHHVADVLCDQFPNVVVRGYTQREGLIWAVHLMTAPSTLRLELSSTFAAGGSLLTSRERGAADNAETGAYQQGFPDTDVKTLIANHQARLAAIEGTPLRTIPTAAGLAGYAEAWLVARLGATV